MANFRDINNLAQDDQIWFITLNSAETENFFISPIDFLGSQNKGIKFSPEAKDIVIAIEYHNIDDDDYRFTDSKPFLLQGINNTDVITLSVPYSERRWSIFQTTPTPSPTAIDFRNNLADQKWQSFIQAIPDPESDNIVTILDITGENNHPGRKTCMHITRMNNDNQKISLFDIIREPMGIFATANNWPQATLDQNLSRTHLSDNDRKLFYPSDLKSFRIILHIPMKNAEQIRACCKTCGCPCPRAKDSRKIVIRTVYVALNAGSPQ